MKKELLEEARQEFTERMLSQHLPQTEEQKRHERALKKRLDKKLKEYFIEQGYDPKEFGL